MEYRETPKLSVVLGFLGGAEILGGVIMGVQLLPGSPPSGHQWLFSAYLPSLIWGFSGIISGVMFLAVAAIVAYLAQIRSEAEGVYAKLLKIEKSLGIGKALSRLPHLKEEDTAGTTSAHPDG